jgi:hypothetical protein
MPVNLIPFIDDELTDTHRCVADALQNMPTPKYCTRDELSLRARLGELAAKLESWA